MTDEEWRQKLRKQMEAHSGKKIEDVQLTPEEEAKRKAQWQETVKLLQKKQEVTQQLTKLTSSLNSIRLNTRTLKIILQVTVMNLKVKNNSKSYRILR